MNDIRRFVDLDRGACGAGQLVLDTEGLRLAIKNGGKYGQKRSQNDGNKHAGTSIPIAASKIG